jgi:hypothetical protein
MSRYKCEVGQRVSVVATFKHARVQGTPGSGVQFIFTDPNGLEYVIEGLYEGLGSTVQVRGEMIVDFPGVWWVHNTPGTEIIATSEDWFTVSPRHG